MTDVRNATDFILHDHDPAKWLVLVDQYVLTLTRVGELILPREHAVLRPVVEAFQDDLPGFVDYVRALRDTLPAGEAKINVHQFYRVLAVRHAQQVRRRRLDKALDKAGAVLGRALDPDERRRVAILLEKHWGARRLQLLRDTKKQLGRRVSTAERAELLDQFWAEVDAEIAAGRLPMFQL